MPMGKGCQANQRSQQQKRSLSRVQGKVNQVLEAANHKSTFERIMKQRMSLVMLLITTMTTTSASRNGRNDVFRKLFRLENGTLSTRHRELVFLILLLYVITSRMNLISQICLREVLHFARRTMVEALDEVWWDKNKLKQESKTKAKSKTRCL